MKRAVRIGGASGFWGDSSFAFEQLLRRGDVDYIVADYLAELTLAIMAKQKERDPNGGFATDFVALALRPILGDLLGRGIRVVTNAGGINPRGCVRALQEAAASLGLSPRIGLVEGDDLMPRLPELRRSGTIEMFTGEPLPKDVVSVNAYLGAFPIAAALDAGADIVVTGRCADSALALGPLIHEFGWGVEDYDLLAGGSMAGHLIECGTQATGGLFTDWREVPGRAEIGYPIAECYPDGRFALTKPRDTGGLVAPLVAIEQLLYEVGDPRDYLLPDVTCDISETDVSARDGDTVLVSGIKGRPPTDSLKVSAIHLDGYRATAMLTMVGRDAAEKAALVGAVVLERTRALLRRGNLGDYSETNVEILGSERASYGTTARDTAAREVVLRISVRHPLRDALELFAREIAPFGTSGTPGTTGFAGRPKPQAVHRLFSFLTPKDGIEVAVSVDGRPVPFSMARGAPYRPAAAPAPAPVPLAGPRRKIALRDIAVARSGDKADISHLAIIARDKALYPLLLEQVTEARIADHFAHLVKGKVRRFDLPGPASVIFMMHEALDGGGTASLRSDALGKAMAEIALDMEIDAPEDLAAVSSAI